MNYQVFLGKALRLLGLTSLAAAPVIAQDEARPDRLLRLLPVGESPPHVEKIENGIRVEQEAPEGAIPPRQVVQLSKKGVERGNPVRLQLDKLSTPLAVRQGTVSLYETGAGGVNTKPWTKVQVSRASHSLAVLWRDPEVGKWSKTRSITLPDDLRSFPAGRVRFINVAPWVAVLTYNGKNIKLPPYKNLILPHQNPSDLKVYMQAPNGGYEKVFDSGVQQSEQERTNVLIYRADRDEPRNPAKVIPFRERARLPKIPN